MYTNNKHSITNYLKFILPSMVGILLFMIPIKYEEKVIVPIAILINKTVDFIGPYLPELVLVLITSSVVITIMVSIFKPQTLMKNGIVRSLFLVNNTWLTIRIIGFLLIIAVYYNLFTDIIYSPYTGGLILDELLSFLVVVFLFAGLFTPLLLNYGLLEFIGTYLSKVMRPLFKLPGRASVDCMTSWLGDGTVGVMITNKQYEDGYYTDYESSVIATCFSFVSITFSFTVISQVGLSDYFPQYYLTVTVAGLVAAIIMPRIPPLSRKRHTFYQNQSSQMNEVIPKGETLHSWAVKQSLEKANRSGGLKEYFKAGTESVLGLWFGVLPVVMAFGTIALIIAEYTPIFNVLGYPFYPILQLFNVAEALEASKTIVIGFADMLLPTIIASNRISNSETLFIIASLSVSQLIYLSEVGGIILGSKIPLKLGELFIIFLLRTLVTLPIIVLFAKLFTSMGAL